VSLNARLRPAHADSFLFRGTAYADDKKREIEAGADAYVIKPDLDGLLGSITQLVSHAENATATIVPFGRKTSFSPPFAFEPAAA
jgi:hypothetical protein